MNLLQNFYIALRQTDGR